MTKKDLFLLVLPAVGLVIMGVSMVVFAELADARYFWVPPARAKESFEQYAKRVESGAEQVPPKRWLDMLRSSRETDEATCGLARRVTSVQRVNGWCIAAIAVSQFLLVLSVIRRLRPNKSLQATAAAPES